MIVFGESNFVLELVLQQAEASSAIRIVELAETGHIQLCVPAFSLVEPKHKLLKARGERAPLKLALEAQVKEMARSANFADIRAQSNALLAALANKSDADIRDYKDWLDRIVKCATILPLTKDTVTAALRRSLLDLELLDAFVFCSIQAHLKTLDGKESLFANRDAKGFMQPSVLDDLQRIGCKVIPSFADALGYIESRLSVNLKT